jgi:putative endonuclease
VRSPSVTPDSRASGVIRVPAMTAWVCILASKPRGTLDVGVTNDPLRRVVEHREREKRLKRWARSWKIDLIRSRNPDWRDLFEDIAG